MLVSFRRMDQVSNQIFFIFGIIFVIGVVINVLLYALKGRGGGFYPFEKQGALFTPEERSFLGVLDQAIGTEYRIFGKVRLADLIKVKKGMGRKSYFQAFNRISAKHIDYVMCRADDLSIELLIELDDKSHSKASQVKRDKFVDAAVGAAGVPILHILAKRSYSVEEIAFKVQEALGVVTAEAVEGSVVPKSE